MAYLIGLFLVLAVIFSATSGTDLLGDIFNPFEKLGAIKDKISQTISPKTKNEIVIENLNDSYQTLEGFFSGTAQNISNSKDVSTKDKEALKKAAEAFTKSKELVANLGQLQKEDKSLLKSALEKVLGLDKEPVLEPTSIPPQCKLVCGK